MIFPHFALFLCFDRRGLEVITSRAGAEEIVVLVSRLHSPSSGSVEVGGERQRQDSGQPGKGRTRTSEAFTFLKKRLRPKTNFALAAMLGDADGAGADATSPQYLTSPSASSFTSACFTATAGPGGRPGVC